MDTWKWCHGCDQSHLSSAEATTKYVCVLLMCLSCGSNDMNMKHTGANWVQSHNAAMLQASGCGSQILLVMCSQLVQHLRILECSEMSASEWKNGFDLYSTTAALLFVLVGTNSHLTKFIIYSWPFVWHPTCESCSFWVEWETATCWITYSRGYRYSSSSRATSDVGVCLSTYAYWFFLS